MKGGKTREHFAGRLILAVFFFSGFASLLYQVAWQRLLTVNYGVGFLSMVLIVSVYMLGLGIGSFAGGLLAEKVKNKILLYFFIELLIGIFGFTSPYFLDFLQRTTAGSNYMVSFGFIFLFLCIPTFLMGTTLPLLTKIYNSVIQNFFESLSRLYFINTLGAAAGALISSYIIITFFGLDTAVYSAAFINFILAFLIFYLSRSERQENAAPEEKNSSAGTAWPKKYIYSIVFITGFLAIGYEIIWFRVVGILIKDSPYAFSTMLFVYLLGIAAGSERILKYVRRKRTEDKASLFFSLQTGIGLYVAAFFIFFHLFNGYPVLNALVTATFKSDVLPPLQAPHTFFEFFKFSAILFWPAVFFFIPALMMGASFPLISDMAYSGKGDEAKTVGSVYFFTISGNVLGGLVTGFVLLPLLTTAKTVMIFSGIGILFALLIARFRKKNVSLLQKTMFAVLSLGAIAFAFPKNYSLYRDLHRMPWGFNPKNAPLITEGKEGVVCTYTSGDSLKCFINGSSHGGRPQLFFHYETIEALACAGSRDHVLVFGLGTGTVLEAVLKDPEVKQVTLVELNGTLIRNLSQLSLYKKMFADKRLRIVIEDGRRLLYTNIRPFDLILMDPLRTRTAYSNNIYSKEFFELCKRNLSPAGVIMIWCDEFNVLPNTVSRVFTHMRYYVTFMLASEHMMAPGFPIKEKLLALYPEEERNELRLFDASYAGDEQLIKKEKGKFPVNRDWKPVTEYYFGR